MEEKPIKRLYYSIAEVSEITGLKPYVLRYWETEFPELNPTKNRAGNRAYKKSDIQLIFTIKRLLYTEKFTIEGARQKLLQIREKNTPTLQIPFSEDKENFIETLRAGLIDCMKILNE